MRGWDRSDEELASIRVGAGVGHRQQVFDVVLQSEAASFVGKLLTVNALAACSVMPREITALTHKVRNDSVKARAFVRQRDLGVAFAHTGRTSTQREEVLDGSGGSRVEHFENDTLGLRVADFDIPG